MKRPILYTMLFLALTATLSSCEEDPVIPTVNYRKVTTQITANLPEGVTMDNIQYQYRFCIDQCLYMYGEYRQDIDGDTPREGGVLYEYNTSTNKWDIAWYASSQEIKRLRDSGKEEDYKKAEQLIRMGESVLKCTDRDCCGYNGKGYIYTNENTLEFDPSTKTMTIYDNTSRMNDVRVFSRAEGVLAIDRSSNSLYQYSTNEHIWKFVATINNANSILSEYYDILDSPKEDKLYIWNSDNDYQHSIDSYVYPYTSIQQTRFVKVPHDYGWSDYIDHAPQDIPFSAKTFTINGKIYRISDNQTYYEYNPADNTISIIKDTNNMDYSRYLLATIGNKLYFASVSQIGYIAF